MKTSDILAWYDGLPKFVRILAQIFLGYIICGVYRILKFVDSKNVVTLVAGILVLVTGVGNAIAWVVDLVTEILYDKITVLAD